MFDLTGKTALVTGSTQGIGKAIAKCLLRQGANVFIHGSTSMKKCQTVSEELGDRAFVAFGDLSKDGCAESLYQQTGPVDILVLNASVQYRAPWNEITSDEFDKQIRVNLKSSLELIQTYAPHMQSQNWGRIVTIGSVNQYNNHPELSLYSVTKTAQKKLVENWASALAPYGITVNNVAPGAINTPRNESVLSDESFHQKVISSIPAGYVGTAEDVAPAVLLLCSNEGRYITGSEIIVDGGIHL